MCVLVQGLPALAPCCGRTYNQSLEGNIRATSDTDTVGVRAEAAPCFRDALQFMG